MGALSTLASIGISAATSRSKTGAANKAIEVDAASDIAKVKARDAAERKTRSRKLEEGVARQRALAASSGAGGSGGSTAALRRGLEERVLEDDAYAAQQRKLAVESIRSRAGAQRQRNLLESRGRMAKSAVGGVAGIAGSLLGD